MTIAIIAWAALAAANFIIQLLYFRQDDSQILYMAKRITMPLLLLLSGLIAISSGETFALVPAGLLIAMGIGEIGIEGSPVVEDTSNKTGTHSAVARLMVTSAGVIFLLVNIVLGVYLMGPSISAGIIPIPTLVLISLLSGIALLILIFAVFRLRHTERNLRAQMIIYALGIWVLATGAAIGMLGKAGNIAMAGGILAISDSLVLVRMGAGWKKSHPRERIILACFLIAILLLYYAFMFLMMMASG